MRNSCFLILLLLLSQLGLMNLSIATPKGKTEAHCPYPESPINWITKYCSLLIETHDEIAIQDSKCFQDVKSDLNSKNKCATNKKYKTKTCSLLIKNKYTNHKSIEHCLKDKDVDPFIAGE